MEAYARALAIVLPIYTLMILVELAYDRYTQKRTYRVFDTVCGISSGLTNAIKDVVGIGLAIVSYAFLVDYLALFEMKASFAVYVIGFVLVDVAGYVRHRFLHSVNFFWNCEHITHHSSEEFNLSVALRQPLLDVVDYFPFLLIPAAIVGVPAEVIATILPIRVFMQFWYHTRHIGKLGILEYILITPSQHRVHHATNPKYLDKNLGQIFCIWDRMFGTFQEELDDEPPVYGTLTPARTWNPFLINVMYPWRLICDCWWARGWREKLKVWVARTGWRPAEAEHRWPVDRIEDVRSFEKYDSGGSALLVAYSVFQLVFSLMLSQFLFLNYGSQDFPSVVLYSSIILTGVFGYTSLMDGTRAAVGVEILRCSAALAVIFATGDWFGLNAYWSLGSTFVMVGFALTLAIALYLGTLGRLGRNALPVST